MFHRNYVHRSNLWGASFIAFVVGAAAWAIFGKKAQKKLEKNPEFKEIRDQVYDKASRVSELTREKYDQIVDEVSDKYAAAKGISKHEMVDLVEDLKMHWRRIKDAWNNN